MPLKYYTREDKRNQVYEQITENLHENYFLTIDTFKLPEQATSDSTPKILYKISDFRVFQRCSIIDESTRNSPSHLAEPAQHEPLRIFQPESLTNTLPENARNSGPG